MKKVKKLLNKKKLIIGFAIIIGICLIVSGALLVYVKAYLPNQLENKQDVSVSVFKENGLKIDQLSFKEKSYLQVLDEQGNETDRIQLNEDENNIELHATGENSLLLDTWEIEQKTKDNGTFQNNETYFVAKPVYQSQKDFVLTFIADEQSNLIEKNQGVKAMNKAYTADSKVKAYLPSVKINDGFKGDWKINNEPIADDTQVNENTIIEFQTYQDKNDNDIDDFTEKFKVNFVTNTEETFDEKEVAWEESIELPELTTLENEDKVFYQWYSDENFETVFTNDSKITSDLTLYADVRTIPDIINQSIEQPIEDEKVAVRVQDFLNSENKTVDQNFNKEVKEKEKAREEEKAYNEENNIIEKSKEVVTELHNLGQNKLYLITFLDPLNNYLYSIVAPYGQTIKVVDEQGELYKEYSARQDSTIILNQETLLKGSTDLDHYDFEYRQINDSVFIKVQPIGNKN